MGRAFFPIKPGLDLQCASESDRDIVQGQCRCFHFIGQPIEAGAADRKALSGDEAERCAGLAAQAPYPVLRRAQRCLATGRWPASDAHAPATSGTRLVGTPARA